MNLNGKTVVITGAMGGIGSELTRQFAAEGAKLVLVERSPQEFQKLPATLNRDIYKYTADFSDIKQVYELGEKLHHDFPKIDILINNAGIGIYKPYSDITWRDWELSFAINVHAPFILTQQLLPSLKAAQGSVIFTGSGSGVLPMAGRAAYSTSKFALRGLGLCLATEFEGQDIRFAHLTLGSTLTDFGPLGVVGKKQLQEQGKKYLMPDYVVSTLIERIKMDDLSAEIILYPGGYDSL